MILVGFSVLFVLIQGFMHCLAGSKLLNSSDLSASYIWNSYMWNYHIQSYSFIFYFAYTVFCSFGYLGTYSVGQTGSAF